MPLSPMKLLRVTIVTPGACASTTKAVMPPRLPSLGGTTAMTTKRLATVPLVAQSLVPFMR